MKLQLSLVVVIAVLMAYIYWTRDWEERGGDELLLGGPFSIKKVIKKAKKEKVEEEKKAKQLPASMPKASDVCEWVERSKSKYR